MREQLNRKWRDGTSMFLVTTNAVGVALKLLKQRSPETYSLLGHQSLLEWTTKWLEFGTSRPRSLPRHLG